MESVSLLLLVLLSLIFFVFFVFFFGVVIFHNRKMIENNKSLRKLEQEKNKQNLKDTLEAQEKERARIGLDIHDDLGPTLSAIKYKANLMAHEMDDQKDDLSYLNELIDQAIGQVRGISHTMYPNTLQRYGLEAALEELATRIEKSSDITVIVSVEGDINGLFMENKLSIYRIVQEFTNNSMKHSGCSNVNIIFNNDDDELSIVLNDNGKGLQQKDGEINYGLGQRSMKMRAELMDMSFTIESEPDQGMTLIMKKTLNKDIQS